MNVKYPLLLKKISIPAIGAACLPVLAVAIISCGGSGEKGSGDSTGVTATGTGGGSSGSSQVASIELVQTAKVIVGGEFDLRIVPRNAAGEALPFVGSQYELTFENSGATSIVHENADGYHLRANSSLTQIEYVRYKPNDIKRGSSYTQYGVWTGQWQWQNLSGFPRTECTLSLTQIGSTLSGDVHTKCAGGEFTEVIQSNANDLTVNLKGLAFTSANPPACTIGNGAFGPCVPTVLNLTYTPNSNPSLVASLYQRPDYVIHRGAVFSLLSR
jgi:hypothetical protein